MKPMPPFAILAVCVLSLSGLFAPTLAAQGIPAGASAAETLARARIFGSDEKASLSMLMRIESGGETKQRTIAVSMDQSSGDSLLQAAIVDPVFLSNMKYLRIRRKGGSLQQWLKTSRGLSRVIGSGSGEKVFGSDFTAEDFGEMTSEDFELVLETAGKDTAGTIRIRARPLVKSPSYSYKVIGISAESGLIVAMDFYDLKDRITRSYRLDEAGSQGGQAYPKRASMSDLRSGGKTTLEVLALDRNPSLPARIFNPAGL